MRVFTHAHTHTVTRIRQAEPQFQSQYHLPHATCHLPLSSLVSPLRVASCNWACVLGFFFSLDFGISRSSVCRGCWRCVRGQRTPLTSDYAPCLMLHIFHAASFSSYRSDGGFPWRSQARRNPTARANSPRDCTCVGVSLWLV